MLVFVRGCFPQTSSLYYKFDFLHTFSFHTAKSCMTLKLDQYQTPHCTTLKATAWPSDNLFQYQTTSCMYTDNNCLTSTIGSKPNSTMHNTDNNCLTRWQGSSNNILYDIYNNCLTSCLTGLIPNYCLYDNKDNCLTRYQTGSIPNHIL